MANPSAGLRYPPPFAVQEHVDRFGDFLDAQRFSSMRTHENALVMVDLQTHRQYDTSVGGRRKRRANWGGRSVVGGPPVSYITDMLFIRCKEERDYEDWLNDILTDRTLADAGQVLDSRLCAFARPFSSIYLVDNTRYWWKDVDFEDRMRCARFTVFAL